MATKLGVLLLALLACSPSVAYAQVSMSRGQIVLREGTNTAAIKNGTISQLFKIYTPGMAITTAEVGLTITNTTEATAGVPVQMSGRVMWRANVWNTTAVAANNSSDFWMENLPVSGANPLGVMRIFHSFNGAAATEVFSVDSGGGVWKAYNSTGLGNLNAVILTGPQWRSQSGDNTNIQLATLGQLTMNRGTGPQGIGIDVGTDGIFKLRNRAQTAPAQFWAGVNAIATTSTDGLLIANETLAVVGVPVQQSPRLRFRSHVWNTTAVAATNTDDWVIESTPTSGATPSGTLKFGSSLNGAAVNPAATLTSSGVLTGVAGLASGGALTLNGSGNSGEVRFQSGTIGTAAAGSGHLWFENGARTIGSLVNIGSLPTVNTGFGTSPSITAGSTPFAGSVNVGTGGAATTGTIDFNGTAFPSVPFCTFSTRTTNGVTRGTPTASTLVLSSTTAWSASDIVSWICISAK